MFAARGVVDLDVAEGVVGPGGRQVVREFHARRLLRRARAHRVDGEADGAARAIEGGGAVIRPGEGAISLEIGRASCWGRVEILAVGRFLKKKRSIRLKKRW